MDVSGIRVQPIKPRSRTGWSDANPAPAQPSDADSDDAPPNPDRAAPAPGAGHLVDKMA
jgi:hypothetical protein